MSKEIENLEEVAYNELRQQFLNAFEFAARNEVAPPIAAFCALELIVCMLKETAPNELVYQRAIRGLWDELCEITDPEAYDAIARATVGDSLSAALEVLRTREGEGLTLTPEQAKAVYRDVWSAEAVLVGHGLVEGGP